MRSLTTALVGVSAVLAAAVSPELAAGGIVGKIVNSPLSAAGLVRDARIGINVYLQDKDAPGDKFMDPEVLGYGISPGGHIDIELGPGFERDPNVAITQKTIMLVGGAPQQGMPGKAVGYKISEGDRPNVIRISSTKPDGLAPEKLMTPAPGAKGDPVRQRGIKVFHIGFLQSAFIARGARGTIGVRFVDGTGEVEHSGAASATVGTAAVAQILPSNFPDRQRNHNWQRTAPGTTLGQASGTLPLPYQLYAAATSTPSDALHKFKKGINGVGLLSTQQLAAKKYEKPAALARYNGGLFVQDTNGDGRLDPKADRIVGGVIGKAPPGAKGQELRSLDLHGAPDLSRPTTAYHPKFGKIFGGSIGLLQFTAGDKTGLYQPTLALMADPSDPSKGDGSTYTYTVVVR